MEFETGKKLDTYITRLAGLHGSAIPKYTTDLNEAFTLPVEGDDFLCLHSPCESAPYWIGFVMNIRGGWLAKYQATTNNGAALALCLAWLQYIAVKRGIHHLRTGLESWMKDQIDTKSEFKQAWHESMTGQHRPLEDVLNDLDNKE